MNYILKKNKKILVAVLILLAFIIAFFLWYNEEGTNKEAPKKAIYVMGYIKGGGHDRKGTSIHKS